MRTATGIISKALSARDSTVVTLRSIDRSRDRFIRQITPSRATVCRWPDRAPPKARRSTSTARRRSPPLSRDRRGVSRLSARAPLRAQGELDAGDRAPAAHARRRADANSGGEIDVALRAGFSREQIVFTGVGKTRGGTGAGDRSGRQDHQRRIGQASWIASTRLRASGGRAARVALRVNPDIDARSHPHISTGLKANKFGVPLDAVRDICRRSPARAGLEFVGSAHPRRLANHQISSRSRVRRGDRGTRQATCVTTGSPSIISTSAADLASSYDGAPVPSPEDYAAAVLPVVRDSGLPMILEPGRSIVGPAGVLLSPRRRRQGCDRTARCSSILDAGMTELMRPMLYGAFHRIEAVQSRRTRRRRRADIVGPLCESSDTLGRTSPEAAAAGRSVCGARCGRLRRGDGIELQPAARCPPEVLVDGGRWSVIRRRQTIDDLLALEI